jgi:hypothetical protein
LEIYLYDWWPIYEDRRRLERLARINVRIVMPQTGLPAFSPIDEPDRGHFTETAA